MFKQLKCQTIKVYHVFWSVFFNKYYWYISSFLLENRENLFIFIFRADTYLKSDIYKYAFIITPIWHQTSKFFYYKYNLN